jgi:hypothetical protein
VAKSSPDKIEVATSTGTDQLITPIARPKIGFAITAVGSPIKKNVAMATLTAVIQRLAGHNRMALRQLGLIIDQKSC